MSTLAWIIIGVLVVIILLLLGFIWWFLNGLGKGLMSLIKAFCR